MEDPARKRLLYRSWHRGCKETDLLLGPYAERTLPQMDEAALSLYAALLEEADQDIWDWVTHRTPVPVRYAALITALGGQKERAS